MWWNVVSHMATSNLQNFGPCLCQIHEIRLFSRNLTDFVNYNKPFVLIYSVLNKLSKYVYFYISKNITSYTFLPIFKIVESFQYILKNTFSYR